MTRPIFILSLPRSGSTMLQRLMMTNKRAASFGEPSLLLRLLGNDDLSTRRSAYWDYLVDYSIEDMQEHWPDFDSSYRAGVRRLMLDLYTGLAGGKPYFIDKTPRYTLIAEEIIKTFPDAKFIVLWRHPLAVASSMHHTWGPGYWFPEEHSVDLYEGMMRLHAFTRAFEDQICIVRYENLVTDPAAELRRISEYLDWPNLDEAIDKPLPKPLGGRLGDPTGAKKFRKISADSLSEWTKTYNNFYRRRWAREYVSGPRADAMAAMDYHLPSEFSENNPLGLRTGISEWIRASRRRSRLMKNPKWPKSSWREYKTKYGFDVSWR